MGLLPLVHTHSFAVMLVASCCWVLLFPDRKAWSRLLTVAIVAAPSLAWLFSGSGMAARAFLARQVGWDHGADNVFWFWLYNTGLVLPALVVALVWRGREPIVPRRLALFLLPFAGLFIVPNLLRLAPWMWDNIKFLFYWYLASTPILALLLVRLWRRPAAWAKALAVLTGVSLTLAGALDVWRVVSRQSAQRIFDKPGMAFARLVIENTAPRAVIVRQPTYNHPVLLTGRRSYLGYAGHLYSQGLDPGRREQDVDGLYRGLPGSIERMRSAGVDYVVVGPMERSGYPVNDELMSSLPLVGEMNGFRLYRIPGR
jgi:hypothetical protein